MASIIASRSPSPARDSSYAIKELESTIAGFQAILTDDDRKRLQQLKTAPHDAQSIILFTAELDSADTGRRGKSVATRLASFLQTIQQFTPIIDTYIQSNPDISALIWGSIRLTFLFLANFTSYFQSFVELLNGFGTLCTRFAEYQLIFHDSTRLGDAVCRFHTAIITCCNRILMATRRPVKSQLLRAITQSFQTELRTYVEDIRAKAENVERDIELVKAKLDREEQQLQTKERKEASDYRKHLMALTSKYTAELSLFQAQKNKTATEQQRRRLLQELSSFNFISTFNHQRNKRHHGTAEWVFQTSEYQQWIKGQSTPVLHITGKIGSGKTVLAASVIEKLCQVQLPRRFTSFVFLRFDNSESLKADTIIRSCIYQLLSALAADQLDPKFASELGQVLEQAKSDMFSNTSLMGLYSKVPPSMEDWFIIVDGLDECTSSDQTAVLNFFQGILTLSPQTSPIKLLLSSRETSTRTIDQSFPGCVRVKTGSSHTSTDICTYAEDIIRVKLLQEELVVGNSDIIKDILMTIKLKEQGMFLWAFLSIEDICSRKSDKDIRQALVEIPTDLPATFDRALGRITRKKNQDIAKKTFAWVQAVFQPLTLRQLQEALSVEIGQRSLRQDDLISGIHRLPAWCENLVLVEEADDTIHFSHHSIREYLLKPSSGDYSALHINTRASHQLVGETCITYIGFESLDRPGANGTARDINLNMGEITAQTIESAVKGGMSNRLGRILRSVPKLRQSEPSSTTDILTPYLTQTELGHEDTQYHLSRYANGNWYKHTTYLDSENNTGTWELLGKILRGDTPSSQRVVWQDRRWIRRLYESYCRRLLSFELDLHISLESYDPYIAFLHAEHHKNWGLCCRAFISILEDYQRNQENSLKAILHILVATKNHKACRGRCLSALRPHIDHRPFIRGLHEAIAQGIPEFPGLEQRGNDKKEKCKCAEYPSFPLQEDICNVLWKGYCQKDYPLLHALTATSRTLNHGNLSTSAKSLCQAAQLSLHDLFNCRTHCSRSVFDILAGAIVWNTRKGRIVMFNMEDFFASLEESRAWKHRTTDTVRLLESLSSACVGGKGAVQEKEETLQNCYQALPFYGGIVPLHEATIEQIFIELIVPVLRPRNVLAPVVFLFFRDSISIDLGHVYERIFRRAVWHNNWDLAACLIRLEFNNSGQFGLIKAALRCQGCHSEISKGTKIQVVNDIIQNPFHLCFDHWSRIQAVMTSDMLCPETRSIMCSGSPTESLPPLEIDSLAT